jgi:hypothetical protein
MELDLATSARPCEISTKNDCSSHHRQPAVLAIGHLLCPLLPFGARGSYLRLPVNRLPIRLFGVCTAD